MPLCCTAKIDISTRLINSAVVVRRGVGPLSTVLGTTYPDTKPTA
jgi:hypothetical protein